MSELLWPMYHELKARMDKLEAFLNRVRPNWNAPPEPEVPADYNDPAQTDTDADSPPPVDA